jgi:hypothetical protein
MQLLLLLLLLPVALLLLLNDLTDLFGRVLTN